MNKDFFLKNKLESLKLYMYMLGYKNEGESILILLKCEKLVIFSCIIDNCTREDENKSIKILKEHGVKGLDIIAFTHPHSDHTKGIKDILNEFKKKDTLIIFSDNMLINSDKIDLTREEKEIFNELKELIIKDDYLNIIQSSCNYDIPENILNLKIIEEETSRVEILNLKTLAPNRNYLCKKILKNYKNINPNFFSLAFCITFDGFNIFIGGDIENESICLIKDEFISSANIIKIPHHCSKTSDKLLEKLNYSYKENRIVCSSVSRKHNLPDNKIINEYLHLSKTFHLTNNINKEDDCFNYGFICYEYYNNKLHSQLEKNAICISEEI